MYIVYISKYAKSYAIIRQTRNQILFSGSIECQISKVSLYAMPKGVYWVTKEGGGGGSKYSCFV